MNAEQLFDKLKQD